MQSHVLCAVIKQLKSETHIYTSDNLEMSDVSEIYLYSRIAQLYSGMTARDVRLSEICLYSWIAQLYRGMAACDVRHH